jgi:Tfp pilus assembly protein PilO
MTKDGKGDWFTGIMGVAAIVLVVVVVMGLTYGGYVLHRWVNWKLSYESKVEEAAEPLEKRLGDLERRVEILERNYKTDVEIRVPERLKLELLWERVRKLEGR